MKRKISRERDRKEIENGNGAAIKTYYPKGDEGLEFFELLKPEQFPERRTYPPEWVHYYISRLLKEGWWSPLNFSPYRHSIRALRGAFPKGFSLRGPVVPVQQVMPSPLPSTWWFKSPFDHLNVMDILVYSMQVRRETMGKDGHNISLSQAVKNAIADPAAMLSRKAIAALGREEDISLIPAFSFADELKQFNWDIMKSVGIPAALLGSSE